MSIGIFIIGVKGEKKEMNKKKNYWYKACQDKKKKITTYKMSELVWESRRHNNVVERLLSFIFFIYTQIKLNMLDKQTGYKIF